MLVAVTSTTLGTMPIFLFGAEAVLVRRDVPFSEFQLGLASTVFFTAAALLSVPVGHLVERAGRRLGIALGGVFAAISLLGIAVIASSYLALLAFLVVGGLANATSQVSSNLLLARLVPDRRQGVAFAIKQSAIPLSTLAGGVAVPVIGLTLGWRWTFAVAALIAILVALVGPWVVPPFRVSAERAGGDLPSAALGLFPLIVMAAATALASASSNALGSFLVSWSVRAGIGVGAAGVLLAAASVTSVLARILVGVQADRRGRRHLPVVTMQLAGGAIAFVALSFATPASVVVGALLAFAVGWSWPGLLVFAVVRVGRQTPALASSLVQLGAFIGGATGPGAFGLLVHAWSYPWAWRCFAVVMLLAATFVVIGRRMIVTRLGTVSAR